MRKGQILVVGMIFSVLLVSLLTYNLYLGQASYNKIRLQNIADSAAYSGSVMEAKVLNGVAALNQGIVFITNLVTKIVLVWLFLKACAGLCLLGGIGCICVAPLSYFERYAKKVLKLLEDIAWSMARTQDRLLKAGPFLVLASVKGIAERNKAKLKAIYPFLPTGAATRKASLAFHLKRADKNDDLSSTGLSKDSLKLVKKGEDSLMSCYIKRWGAAEYTKAKEYWIRTGWSKKIDWSYRTSTGKEIKSDEPKGESWSYGGEIHPFHEASTTECKKVPDILKMGIKLPNPLIEDRYFTKRQRLAVLISGKPFKQFHNLDDNRERGRDFYAVAQSRPQGSSTFEMDWEARMEAVSLMNDLMTH